MALTDLARALAAQLALERPLVCLDIEATGVWVERDRIVQIALARIDPDGAVTEWASLVNPGQPIPADATAVHGIADADVAAAPTFADLAPTIAGHLTGYDLAGYNIQRFDRRMLAAEFRRVEVPDPTSGARVVDGYTIFVRQEPRSLEAAVRFYRVDEAVAGRRPHDARGDVAATVAVLASQMAEYPGLPRTVGALHEWLYPRGADWVDPDGKLVWRDGAAVVTFGSGAGVPLTELASTDRGFLEWILRRDFSDDVKRIVRDALDGRFPERSPATPS